jgi:2-methylcitrate dehydratase
VDYHEPSKRSIGNALLVTLNDGTVLPEVEIEYPVGHKRRRTEGTPLLIQKFKRHIAWHFDEAHQKRSVVFLSLYRASDLHLFCRILDVVSDAKSLSKLPVDKFTDLFVKP